MNEAGEPDDLELAALLCSRLCHDVISPVGAISNGFEVLEDEKDESMREMALDIIRSNARKASARLQFARLAFGAMGAAGDRFPLDEARQLTTSLYEGEKVQVAWPLTGQALPKDQVKLLVNLVMIAAQAIPRGGEVSVEATSEGDAARFRLVSRGVNAVVPRSSPVFEGTFPEGRVDAHSIQPYYASRLARSLGMAVFFASREDGSVEVMAETQPQVAERASAFSQT